MADYIYLLETRLSAAQKGALRTIREIARGQQLTVFLVGGAVRDLTSGSPVRDLDVVVQGNALKLNKIIEKAGGFITGTNDVYHALHVRFPGNVRMEIGSTLAVDFPKPGKPVVKTATILDDLRRRDFTANAMALSLNGGSYGLLMDPLNGVADIENRELRLVSNYGFIDDPIRMIRAARYSARLGWQLEVKTQTRYENGKSEGYISALQAGPRGYEVEEIVHEEDPLRVIRRLETEGWMTHLAPAWTAAKANAAELEKLREAQMQLQMQGVYADSSAAQFPLLTAKMAPKDVSALKAMFPRQGFVAEIEALEAEAKAFATELSGKQAASASASWKLIAGGRPEAVLWTAYSTKSAALQAKFKSFYSEWPAAKQKIPYLLMQEMRINPEVPRYNELMEGMLFELMDGRLGTVEEMKAYLEPFSPPAPPPPVNLRRARGPKKEAKPKSRKKAAAVADVSDDEIDGVETQSDAVSPEKAVPEIGVVAVAPPAAVAAKVAAKAVAAPAVKTVAAKVVPAKLPAPAVKAAPAKLPAPAVKTAPAKLPAPAVKTAPVKLPAPKAVQKPAAKSIAATKAPARSGRVASKGAPAKKAAKKTVAKKAVAAKKTVAVKAPAKASKVLAKKTVPAKASKAPAKKTPAKTVVGMSAGKASAKNTPAKPVKVAAKKKR